MTMRSDLVTNPESNMEMTSLVMEGLAKFAADKEANAAKTAEAAPAKAAGTGLKSEVYFNLMNDHLAAGNGADIIKKVAATFAFEIIPKKGAKPVAGCSFYCLGSFSL